MAKPSQGRLHLIAIMWPPVCGITYYLTDSLVISIFPFLIGLYFVVRIFSKKK